MDAAICRGYLLTKNRPVRDFGGFRFVFLLIRGEIQTTELHRDPQSVPWTIAPLPVVHKPLLCDGEDGAVNDVSKGAASIAAGVRGSIGEMV